MPYSDKLADRIRERISHLPKIEEKEMMGGLSFMVNGKMCVGVIGEEMICRIDQDQYEQALEQNGIRPMDFTGRPMKGWIFVEHEGMKSKKTFDNWVEMALEFNKKAKASPKNKKSTGK